MLSILLALLVQLIGGGIPSNASTLGPASSPIQTASTLGPAG